MTLLAPMALLLGLSGLVPLILHLYQRRERVVMLFSTNRFFTQSIIRSQRRLRLRRLLLLLLRVAVCLLFALALAKPLVGLTPLTGGAGQRDIVILLDDSLSMQAASSQPMDSAASKTGFDQAKVLATDVLKTLVAGDRAAILTFTGRQMGKQTRAGIELSEDIVGMADQVTQLSATTAAGDASFAMKQAAEMLTGTSRRTRSLLCISDMQEADWPAGDWPQPQATARALLARQQPPTHDNLTLNEAFLSQTTTIVGQPNLLRVRLINHRPTSSNVQLILDVDGQEVSRRTVDLPGQSPHIERIPFVLETAGEHGLSVRIDAHDALPADNVLYLVAKAGAPLPVLLVDGAVQTVREKPAAFYLQTALESVSTQQDAESTPVKVVSPASLATEHLERYRIAFLCNVANLPVTQVEQLEQFVRAGGGLTILLGDSADLDFYNNILGAPSRPAGGLMPATIRSRLGVDGGAAPMHIVEAQLDHPILQRFAGPLRSALSGISIYQAYGLAPGEGWVLATMDGTMPLLVERSYGAGRVLLVATMPTPSWTDWPLRRAFIPMVNAMTSYLAGGAAPAGEQVTGRNLILTGVAHEQMQSAQVLRPDHSTVPAEYATAGPVPVAMVASHLVDQAGFYSIADHGKSTPAHFWAVNVPRQESATDVLDINDSHKRAGRWQLTIADPAEPASNSAASIMAILTVAPGTTGIWNLLVWLVLAIVCLEPLLANRNPQRKEASEAN